MPGQHSSQGASKADPRSTPDARPHRKILMVTAEYAPLAKTGGLADAVAGLAEALVARGHDVQVLLPRYPHLRQPGAVTHAGGTCEPLPATPGKPIIHLLAAAEFDADPEIYTGDDRDGPRFIRLAQAAVAFGAATGWQPDILHCHDWHSALAPALRIGAVTEFEGGAPEAPDPSTTEPNHALVDEARAAGSSSPKCILTLHNVGYQGVFPESVLESAGAQRLAALRDGPERVNGQVNFLKLGIRHADALTTVSPTYAAEILQPEAGMGLEATLMTRRDALTGILNGVDYGTWSPESDPFLDDNYSLGDLAGKERTKRKLEAALGLPAEGAPLIGVVTRLAWQKGIDLIADALPVLIDRTNARFALLGSGDSDLERRLRELADRHPQRIAFHRGHDEELAHRIFAGSDYILVPSRYEPCGLTQLYALRYGAIPIVRATGGLADTVRTFNPATGQGNGMTFENPDSDDLVNAVIDALEWYGSETSWSRLTTNAMQADFSWALQVHRYEQLYDRVLAG